MKNNYNIDLSDKCITPVTDSTMNFIASCLTIIISAHNTYFVPNQFGGFNRKILLDDQDQMFILLNKLNDYVAKQGDSCTIILDEEHFNVIVECYSYSKEFGKYITIKNKLGGDIGAFNILFDDDNKIIDASLSISNIGEFIYFSKSV